MINRLAIGTAQFGSDYGITNRSVSASDADAAEVLRVARAGGVTTIDTAIAYGDSERLLGGLGMASWDVITKVGMPPPDVSDLSDWFCGQLTASLNRLGIDQLETVLFHDPEQLFGVRGGALFEGLLRCKEKGLVRKLGISIYEPSALGRYLEQFALDVVQSPFNLLDRRLASEGWLSRLKQRGIEVHVRSVFLQGVLLMDPEARRFRFGAWTPVWDQFDDWIQSTGNSRLEACLSYVAAIEGIDKLVIGVDSSEQMEQVLEAFGSKPPVAPESLQTDDLEVIDPRRWH